MTIDINELRRLAQEAMHPVTKGRWMHLFGESTVYDRLEDGCRGIPVVSTPFSPSQPFEAACLDFIAAANPAAISELLDRLEAAEKERDALRGKAEAVEKTLSCCQAEREEAAALFLSVKTKLLAERDALRAKIEQMERQAPAGTLHDDGCFVWRETAPHQSNYAGWKMVLYALPGAQPAPSMASGDVSLISEGKTQPAPSVPDDGFKRAVMEIKDVGYGALFKHLICERAAELAAAPEAKP